MPKYYALEKKGTSADLYIFGNITSYPWKEKDRDAYSIVKELEELGAEEVKVHINSYGGEVAEGLAIYNTLKNSKMKVATYCDGFACSAASVIFMAGDERIMNEASLLMIHNAWSYGYGNANELRKQADDLDKITKASINAYMSRVSITEEELKQKMDEESWITAEEAVTDGFATGVLKIEEGTVNQSAFRTIREKLLADPGIAPAQLLESRLTLDVEKIAECVAEKVKDFLPSKEEKNNEKDNSTGWGAFFNGGKAE